VYHHWLISVVHCLRYAARLADRHHITDSAPRQHVLPAGRAADAGRAVEQSAHVKQGIADGVAALGVLCLMRRGTVGRGQVERVDESKMPRPYLFE
jgi:hypothetical protein